MSNFNIYLPLIAFWKETLEYVGTGDICAAAVR